MRSNKWYLAMLVATLMALVACVPTATPSPAPAAQVTKAAPAAAAPTISAAEAAWQKIAQEAIKEGKLTLYSFNLTGDIGAAVTKAFKERYGITMDVVTGPGAQLVERINSEQRSGQYVVDAMDGSPALVIQSKQGGSTVSWPSLPALQEKEVWKFFPVLDKDNHLLKITPSLFTPYYNTNLVKAEEVPKSWKDFLAPKWKGKIGISNPDTVPTLNRLYTLLIGRGVLDASYFSELAKQEVKFYATFRDDIAATARGEVALALSSSPSVANVLIKQGAPVRPFNIPEGMVANGAAVVAIKNAPHTNAAQVYMNWLLSKEGQSVYHQAIGSISLRQDVPDFTPPEGQMNIGKFIAETEDDILEMSRLQRERVLAKMFAK